MQYDHNVARHVGNIDHALYCYIKKDRFLLDNDHLCRELRHENLPFTTPPT